MEGFLFSLSCCKTSGSLSCSFFNSPLCLVLERVSPLLWDANCSFLLFPALSLSPDFRVCLLWSLTFVLEALLKCLVSLAILYI